MKKHLEISSFYTSAPKIMIICYTVPEIWCVVDVILFFHFGLFSALFNILIFQVFREVKGQKKCSKWQKILFATLYVSGTIHSYDFHLKFFQNFDFLGCYWGKRAKSGPKWQKNLCCTQYLRNHILYDCHL